MIGEGWHGQGASSHRASIGRARRRSPKERVSSKRIVAFGLALAASLASVLLPACRAPLSVTTRVSLSASVTRPWALRGTRSEVDPPQ
jgi:hypothetical protein